MAITTDIAAYAGETIILSVPVYDEDGDAKVLSAASAVSFVLALTGGSLTKSLGSGVVIDTTDTNTIRITLDADDTASAAAGAYGYQVYVTDVDNVVGCVADGELSLTAKLS